MIGYPSRPMTNVGRAALAILETGRKPTTPEALPIVRAFYADAGQRRGRYAARGS